MNRDDRIELAMDKYKNHPSITVIKRKLKVYEQLQFSNVDLQPIKMVINARTKLQCPTKHVQNI